MTRTSHSSPDPSRSILLGAPLQPLGAWRPGGGARWRPQQTHKQNNTWWTQGPRAPPTLLRWSGRRHGAAPRSSKDIALCVVSRVFCDAVRVATSPPPDACRADEARAPSLRLVCCLRHAKEQRQPRRSADGALMWALPRAWSYARACTRPCFLSSVFFSCGFVPAGDEFAEACAEEAIGLDDVSHGSINPDSRGRTSIEQHGETSFGAAGGML